MTSICLKTITPFLKLSIDEVRDKFPNIGSGQSRDVYDLGNGYVLKHAALGYTMDNVTEWNVWSHASENLKKYLTPCYLNPHSHQYLFMPKAERVSYPVGGFQNFFADKTDIPGINNLLNAIYSLSESYNLMYLDLTISQNWGLLNGEYKLIDYGLTYNEE